ncbi:5-carboxymethyl-2-hydroxymuconate Delta-isomerase [Streptomyces sp. NPDC093546]|uniref:5-carboxymethyl-2-hydroxymuconate Delta-isomerase n=1 Tax=Streptomyces sp. NPDC093546 TaxID=3366040 RepID=UPI00382F863C
MPHIRVDYSASLEDAFDRRGFALALHPVVADTVSTHVSNCKSRFRHAEETVVGDGSVDGAVIHVAIRLAPGRTDEVKGRLTEAVLALLPAHVKPVENLAVHLSAEAHDFERSYRRR